MADPLPEDDESSVLARFLRPRVDDAGLPIADSLVAVSTSIVFAYIVLATGLARPSWLVAVEWVPQFRSLPFVLPAVGHGLSLATCWVLGAFAANAYRKEAYASTSRLTILRYTWRAGAFAIGCLALTTQLQLLSEYGTQSVGAWAEPGFPSTELDVIVVKRTLETALDVAVQAGAMTAWRLYRASLPAE